MQLPGFRDWLFSEDKKPFFVDENNIVQQGDKDTLLKPDGNPARLRNGPDGWKDTLIKYARNLTYWGLFREFTVPMRFTKDGARILREIHWNKGIEGIVHYAKHKLNRLAYPHVYEAWFIGEIDLSKFRQSQKDETVLINVMEGGLSKLLKAYESSTYDIPINTDADKKTIYLDGIPFTNRIDWVIYNGQQIPGRPAVSYNWLGMGIISQEGTTQGVIVQDVNLDTTSTGIFPNNSYFLWSLDKNIVARVRGRIKGKYEGSSGTHSSNLIIRILKSNISAIVQEINIAAGGPYVEGDTFDVEFDETINVGPEDRLYMRIAVTPDTIEFFTIYGDFIKVEYDVRFTPSYCEGLKGITLFERLTEKLTNGKFGVKSSFLENRDDLIYTCGPALRKYQSDAKIQTSMLDFYQECKLRSKNRYGVGMGIENDKLIMEELDYFFRSEIIVDLGIVDNLEIVDATDIQFNTLKVGYRNQTIDKVNGRDEFNVTQKYSTPHTRVVKEMDLVSPYRADMYGVEVTRIDLSGKDTTDNKADNDTFVLSVIKQAIVEAAYYVGNFRTEINTGQFYIIIPTVLTQIANGLQIKITGSISNDGTYTVENTSYLVVGYTTIRVTQAVTDEIIINGTLTFFNAYMYNLLRPAYTSITGVLHLEETFNVELSPKRGLLNNGALLHSLLDKHDIDKIIFQSGEKNSELSTTLAAETITEKADIVIGSLPEKLFLPYYFNFDTEVPIDLLTIMKANPYGKIKFTDGKTGTVLYGYMWDGGIKPEPNDKQNWKLISANQDLSKLK